MPKKMSLLLSISFCLLNLKLSLFSVYFRQLPNLCIVVLDVEQSKCKSYACMARFDYLKKLIYQLLLRRVVDMTRIRTIHTYFTGRTDQLWSRRRLKLVLLLATVSQFPIQRAILSLSTASFHPPHTLAHEWQILRLNEAENFSQLFKFFLLFMSIFLMRELFVIRNISWQCKCFAINWKRRKEK